MAFKMIEGFKTIFATIQGLAGRTAKLTDPRGVIRMTTGTGYRFLPLEQPRMTHRLCRLRRRDAIGHELLLAPLTHPVRRPCRRQDRSYFYIGISLLQKRYPELEQLVPSYHIASYLGITPISLSRIRALKKK